MAAFGASITKRKRRHPLKSGATVLHTRYVVNFREPRTGKRKQFFFERYKDAIEKRHALLTSVMMGGYSEAQHDLTVSQAVEYWLENRRNEVKPVTWMGYRQAIRYVVGPLLVGTKHERKIYTQTGNNLTGAQPIEMLGSLRIADLTTANIRNWHRILTVQISGHTADLAKKLLRAALSLTAEDFSLRVPPMPSKLGRGRTKPRKAILTLDQIGRLLQAAVRDEKKGIYYAFPFLTGVRPSEQLALLWEDIDVATGLIRIHRMQERDGSITELTKTSAGVRAIPMSPLLKTMLLRWLLLCPRRNGALQRVFPGWGFFQPSTGERRNGGGPLCYQTFLNGYWRPAFVALSLPYVTPHSARHAFISTLQAKGIELGLVAKLAGHANAVVTLRHYTQAVRGGEVAIQALEEAYAAGSRLNDVV
jgi:integrase